MPSPLWTNVPKIIPMVNLESVCAGGAVLLPKSHISDVQPQQEVKVETARAWWNQKHIAAVWHEAQERSLDKIEMYNSKYMRYGEGVLP